MFNLTNESFRSALETDTPSSRLFEVLEIDEWERFHDVFYYLRGSEQRQPTNQVQTFVLNFGTWHSNGSISEVEIDIYWALRN